MQGCPRTTSKHHRSLRPCVTTFGKRGWQVSIEIKDIGSGAPLSVRSHSKRAGARLISCCFGAGSRSLLDLVTTPQELMALGVGFVSLSEALDVTTPSGRAIQRCEGDATTRYTKDQHCRRSPPDYDFSFCVVIKDISAWVSAGIRKPSYRPSHVQEIVRFTRSALSAAAKTSA